MTMAYEPTKIDIRGDKLVTGFSTPGVSDDGKFARMAFVAPDGTEVPLRMPAELVDKFLPELMNLAGECERRRNAGTNPARAYEIKEGNVSQTSDDSVAFNFKISTGQDFRFKLDKIGAKLVWEALGVVLGMVENKSGPIETPTKQ
jgi:hypothetical protein